MKQNKLNNFNNFNNFNDLNRTTDLYASYIDNINVHYTKNFLDKELADEYFQILENNLEYYTDEESSVVVYGKVHNIPRKQVAYGDKNLSYKFSGNNIKAYSWDEDNEICKVLKKIKKKVEMFTGRKFNFVLINRYADGTQHIGAHSDSEKELGETPDIIGVSLGASRDFKLTPWNFQPEKMPNDLTINLEHGSLVAMYHPTNNFWKHSIPKRLTVKEPRISLTFRYIYMDKK